MESNTRNIRNLNTNQTQISDASGSPNISRAIINNAAVIATSDQQPNNPTQITDRSQQHQQTSTTESVSQHQIETTQAGAPRRRIKWTTELNESIVRTYYYVTRCESMITGYRRDLYNSFVLNNPTLSYLSEQNVADRRAAIFRTNLITQTRRNEICAEVRARLDQEQPESTSFVQEASEQNTEITPQIQVTSPDNNLTNNNRAEQDITSNTIAIEKLNCEFRRMEALYADINPYNRPMLRKPKLNKNCHKLVHLFNIHVLSQEISNINSLEKLNALIYCGAAAIITVNGEKIQEEQPQRKKKPEPRWRIRLKLQIEELRRDVGVLSAFTQGARSHRLKNKVSKLLKKYKIHSQRDPENSTPELALDTATQKLKACAAKLRRYNKNHKRRTDNANFNRNQKLFYKTLSNEQEQQRECEIPDKGEIEKFWTQLWGTSVQHTESSWIHEVRNETEHIQEMENVAINITEFKNIIKHLHNWKQPGPDKIQNFWIKKFTTIHEVMLQIINNCMTTPEIIPEFLCEGITYLKPKNQNTNNPANFRPITCLNTSYKIITSCIATKITRHCTQNNIISEKQKGCQQGSLGCKEQLLIDSIVMNQAVKNNRNLKTAFIDYKKAFDKVPHSWLIETLKLHKINNTIIKMLHTMMGYWKTKVHLNTQDTSVSTNHINIKRGIFQGDSLSPLWFCLAINPLSILLDSTNIGFNITYNNNETYKISHILYLDDLKLYAGSENKLTELLKITETFSDTIKMEFGVDKCKKQCVEKGKFTVTDPFISNSGETIECLQPGELYKHLGFKQSIKIDHSPTKREVKEEFSKRLKNIMRSGLNSKNLTRAINSYAIPVLTYSFGIIKWSETDLQGLETLIRTTLTKYRNHHPKSAIQRISLPRHAGGRGIVKISRLCQRQKDNLRMYFSNKALTSDLHKAVKNADINYTPCELQKTEHSEEPQLKTLAEVIEEWKQKPLHGQFICQLSKPEIDLNASFQWLHHGQLYPETEGFFISIQDRVVPTRNYLKYVARKPSMQNESDMCRKCNQGQETIEHILNSCTMLAQSRYKTRHDLLGTQIYLVITKNLGLVSNNEKHFSFLPPPVLQNENYIVYWDRTIITERTVPHNRPDMVVYNKSEKTVQIIDFAITSNINLNTTISTKINKYVQLSEEIKRQWQVEKVTTIPIVISSTAAIPKTTTQALKSIAPNIKIHELQKIIILENCSITRQFLNL